MIYVISKSVKIFNSTYRCSYLRRREKARIMQKFTSQKSGVPVVVNSIYVIILVELIEHLLHILDILIGGQLNVG